MGMAERCIHSLRSLQTSTMFNVHVMWKNFYEIFDSIIIIWVNISLCFFFFASLSSSIRFRPIHEYNCMFFLV